MTAPRILMVGAGAVGQVFAQVLTRGGAKVAFYVKPTHALPAVLPMLAQAKRPESLPAERFTTPEEVAKEQWDQVWLSVPTNAFSDSWLPALLAATGDATFVVLGPEGADFVPEARRAVGAIVFMAWQHPLPGQPGEPALAYWIPPLASVPVSGVRAAPVVDLVRKGGMRAGQVKDATKLGAPVTALLIASVLALEGSGWSLKGFRGRWTQLAGRAAKEMMVADGLAAPWGLLANSPFIRFAFWLTRAMVPFDLEAYLKYHFTKVGQQSRDFLEHWLVRARAGEKATGAMEQLQAALPPR